VRQASAEGFVRIAKAIKKGNADEAQDVLELMMRRLLEEVETTIPESPRALVERLDDS